MSFMRAPVPGSGQRRLANICEKLDRDDDAHGFGILHYAIHQTPQYFISSICAT